jgi:hypothetical protein
MRTSLYSSVLQQSCELTGRVYPPTTEESAMFRTYIGLALRQAWEFYDWPEMREYSKEYFASPYGNATNYNVGNFVYFTTEAKYYQRVGTSGNGIDPATNGILNASKWAEAKNEWTNASNYGNASAYIAGNVVFYAPTELYYQCVLATGGGNYPSNSTYWSVLIPFYRTLSLTHDAQGVVRTNEIGEVLSITHFDPRLLVTDTNVNYSYTSEGIVVDDEIPYVWLKRTQSPPLITDLGYAVTTIPYRFSNYCTYFAGGKMLTVDGKIEMGIEFTNAAAAVLVEEVNKTVRESPAFNQIEVFNR